MWYQTIGPSQSIVYAEYSSSQHLSTEDGPDWAWNFLLAKHMAYHLVTAFPHHHPYSLDLMYGLDSAWYLIYMWDLNSCSLLALYLAQPIFM